MVRAAVCLAPPDAFWQWALLAGACIVTMIITATFLTFVWPIRRRH